MCRRSAGCMRACREIGACPPLLDHCSGLGLPAGSGDWVCRCSPAPPGPRALCVKGSASDRKLAETPAAAGVPAGNLEGTGPSATPIRPPHDAATVASPGTCPGLRHMPGPQQHLARSLQCVQHNIFAIRKPELLLGAPCVGLGGGGKGEPGHGAELGHWQAPKPWLAHLCGQEFLACSWRVARALLCAPVHCVSGALDGARRARGGGDPGRCRLESFRPGAPSAASWFKAVGTPACTGLPAEQGVATVSERCRPSLARAGAQDRGIPTSCRISFADWRRRCTSRHPAARSMATPARWRPGCRTWCAG